MLDNYNEPHHGEEGYYGSQKLRHKSFWQRYRWFVISIGLLVILLAIFAMSTFYLLANRTQTTTTSSSSPNAPSQTPSVNTPVTSTSGPAATATPALATVPAGTFTEPNGGLRLHTNADDPITVTITSMKYNPDENKMVWSLILKNVSSSNQPVNGGTFTLKSDVEGDNYTHQATLARLDTAMSPGDQVQKTITFTFVPYQKASGVSYTLTSSIENANYQFDPYGRTITFDSITMTF